MEYNSSLADHFKKMQAYDQWANGLLMGNIEALPAPDPAALGRMGHILRAQELWLLRLLGEDTSSFTTTWPELSLAECKAKLAELDPKWKGYLGDLKDSDFGRVIAYKNTQGQAGQLPVGGILGQVFDHGTYHRGQIATAIKKAGGTPSSTGFYGFLMQTGK